MQVVDVSAREVVRCPEAYAGRRLRLRDALINIAFEANAVWAYGAGSGAHRIWHDLGYPAQRDGCYWIDATGLLHAGGGRYGHLGGWDAVWAIEEIHAKRPAGRSLALRARAAIRRRFGDASVSIALPLCWPPAPPDAHAPVVVFYVATGDRAVRLCCTLEGAIVSEETLDRAKPGWAPPGPTTMALALEGLLFVALEVGEVHDEALLPLRACWAELIDDELRQRHPSFAAWAGGGSQDG